MSGAFRRAALGCMLAALLVPGLAEAQRQGRGNLDRTQLEERVRAQMGRLIRERLGLNQEQAEALETVVLSFEGQRRELFQQEQATRRRVEAVLIEGGNDQTEARQLIQRMWELREQEAELFREEQEALLEVLTPRQLLQLQELREDLGQRIRALGGGRGGGPASPQRGGSRGGRSGAFRAEPRPAPRSPQPLI